MISAFGVDHGGISKRSGGFFRPAGPGLKAMTAAGKRKGAAEPTGALRTVQTGGKHRAGFNRGRHAG